MNGLILKARKWERAFLLISLLAGSPDLRAGEADSSNYDFPFVTNIVQLRQVVSRDQGEICSYMLEGVVLGANSGSGVVFIQDNSGSEAFEMNLRGYSLLPGQHIRLQGTNYVIRSETGLNLGNRAVVDNNGLHSGTRSYDTVHLKSGRHPICVLWFNRTSTALLEVGCSGPNMALGKIPDAALIRFDKLPKSSSIIDIKGLEYRCFQGEWDRLPDFASLTPVKTGVVTNFDPGVRTRQEHVGLEFKGFFEVPREGLYTFYLDSDDGSRLFLYNTPPQVAVTGPARLPEPRKIAISQPLPAGESTFWAEVEGTVTFLKKQGDGVELELASPEARMRIRLLTGQAEVPLYLLNKSVRVRGLCLNTLNSEGQQVAGLVLSPNKENIQLLGATPELTKPQEEEPANGPLLTTATQVAQIKRTDPVRRYPVKLRGVVIWISDTHDSVVIQDSTRGVYVWSNTVWKRNMPQVGDYLEVEGGTHLGDFAPMVVIGESGWKRLGTGQIPTPVIPTWEQLIRGSLDSQWVEIRGYVIAASSNKISLLLPGGTLHFTLSPVPSEPLEALVNSVVRIRACLFANWNDSTHQFNINKPVKLGSATVLVDTPAAEDPFATEGVRAAELTQFDLRADFFRRVKISAQILQGHGATYFATDNGTGLRFQPAQRATFQPGDNVEIVGLADLRGASPLLRQAVARKTGHSMLPEPRALEIHQVNVKYDATRVWVEGLLIAAKENGKELTMEMQAGLKGFIARVQTREGTTAPWKIGSRLKLRGVFSAESSRIEEASVSSFELLLNSPDDVEVVALPPRWRMRHLVIVVSILAAGLALAFIWIQLLRQQVERRTVRLRREISERERAEQGRAIEQERSRIARDIHDDVGSSLTKISMLIEMMDRQGVSKGEAGAFKQTIADTARDTIQAMDEIVWAVDPKNDTLGEMADYLVYFTEEFLRPTGVSCGLEVPLRLPDIPITAELRHNLFLAIKEALNNAVKHAAAREIKLRLELTEEWLMVEVADNGKGFCPASSLTIGNGLENMRRRLLSIGGELLVQSQAGGGTTVKLRVSLRKNEILVVNQTV